MWPCRIPLTGDGPTGFCAMLSVDGVVHLSASDLVGHLNCHYLTKLDLAVARGELGKPSRWDPVLELLAERGALHEQSYLEHLELTGLSITHVNGFGVDPIAVEQTLDAMRRGVPIIAQGALRAGRWGGRADVLRRIEKPSELGAWSYEVIDTKLARETKGNTVLQICLYSDLLAEAQKFTPELAYVVTPGSDSKPQKFRYFDYAAYYGHDLPVRAADAPRAFVGMLVRARRIRSASRS
jgi:predicted RecB family nuclease